MESKDRTCRKGYFYLVRVSKVTVCNIALESFSLNYSLFLPSNSGKRYERAESRKSLLIFGAFYLLSYLFDFQKPHRGESSGRLDKILGPKQQAERDSAPHR